MQSNRAAKKIFPILIYQSVPLLPVRTHCHLFLFTSNVKENSKNASVHCQKDNLYDHIQLSGFRGSINGTMEVFHEYTQILPNL